MKPNRPVAPPPTASRPERPTLVAVRVLDDVYRVDSGDRVLGYVQVVGRVYVTLSGRVYNTSVEISQSLDLDTAVACLAADA
jgi:hypothetical protein